MKNCHSALASFPGASTRRMRNYFTSITHPIHNLLGGLLCARRSWLLLSALRVSIRYRLTLSWRRRPLGPRIIIY